MIKKKAMVKCIGVMEASIEGFGKKEYKMELES